MKSVLLGLVSASLLLSLHAHAADDRIVGFERISECTAAEPSVISSVKLVHGANPYTLEAIGAQVSELKLEAITSKASTFVDLEKRKVLNFTAQGTQASVIKNLQVSVAREAAHQAQFTAVVSAEAAGRPQTVGNFNCRLISHKDLRFSDLF